jgi:DNA polymerase-3 subunit gamma/tau
VPADNPAMARQTPPPRPAPKAPEPPLRVAQAVSSAAPAEQSAPVVQAQPAVPESAASKAPVIPFAQLEPARWIELFRQLPLTGVARNIAANSVLQQVDAGRVTLMLEEGKATLYNDEHRKRIEGVLADYFAAPLQLRIDIGAVDGETPAAWRARREAERKEAARKAFVEDELVRAVVERFGAEIQYDSIASLNPENLH